MNFKEALEQLKKGKLVARAGWGGYWQRYYDTVHMYTKEGRIIDIVNTTDVFYTLDNMVADDWMVVEGYADTTHEETAAPRSKPLEELFTFDFGNALLYMKKGMKVARKGWNGRNMWVVYMPPLFLDKDVINGRTKKHLGEGVDLDSQGYLAMMNAQGKWQPGWLATQSDVLADDWMVVE